MSRHVAGVQMKPPAWPNATVTQRQPHARPPPSHCSGFLLLLLATTDDSVTANFIFAMRVHATSWEALAAAKRASTLAKIPEAWQLDPADIEDAKKQRDPTGTFIQRFLKPSDIAIVSQDTVSLVDAIKEGKLTAVEVATSFCKTAAVAHQINNCLHEIFFRPGPGACERARRLPC